MGPFMPTWSRAQAGGGLDYVQMTAAACIRFSGKPESEPTVTVGDAPCPNDVAATNVVIVKVGGSG
jgi:hypothetical protein